MSVYQPRRTTPHVRQAQRRAASRQEGGVIRWLVAGAGGAVMLLAGYLVAMHFLQGRASVTQDTPNLFEAREQVAAQKQVDRQAVTQKASDSTVEVDDTKPHPTDGQKKTESFQFYEALPRARLDVDASPLPVRMARPVRILAGTFTDRVRAERERARLAGKGFELEVVPLQRSGRTLYQLRTPLIHSRLEMIRLRNGLQKAGARVLVVRLSPQSQP